ncbi:hypothetical protein ABFX02_13G080500 [Erythranthe guttata]
MASCYVPFNSRNLDISFFVFRPTVVYVDDLLHALKQFSSYTQTLGCVHSSILRSIHGNMLSVLTNVAGMAILIDHSFFDAFTGESRDGTPAAKFFTGDIVSMSSATLSANNDDENKVSYACLAIFKDRFNKMSGARAGVCFKSQSVPRIVCLFVWKSLQFCYTYILTSDYRNTILPYLDGFALDVKYDVFRVVYVSGDNVVKLQNYPQRMMLENEVDNNAGYPFVHDFQDR